MFLALKELKKNKSKYGLILTILTLVIFLVLFLTGLTKGLDSSNSATIKNSDSNYYILDTSSDNLLSRSSVSKEDLDKINELTNNSAEIINLSIANIFSKEDSSSKLNISYLGINEEGFLMPEIIEGSKLSNKNEIILDSSFKDDGFEVGDKIKDVTSEIEFKIVGFTKNQIYSFASTGIISLESYEELIKSSTILKEVNPQGIALNLDKDFDVEELSNFVENNLEEKVLITKDELISSIPGYTAQQGTLITMLVFLLVISALIIAVFFYVTTMQKIPQFGVLKALGAKMSTLGISLATQVFILAIISAIIGNALTFGSAAFLPSSMPFTISISDALMVSALFIIISVASSLFSINKVKKVDAVSAIGGTY